MNNSFFNSPILPQKLVKWYLAELDQLNQPSGGHRTGVNSRELIF